MWCSRVKACVQQVGNVALGYQMAGLADGYEGNRGTRMLRPWYMAGCLCRSSFRGCCWGWCCSTCGHISVEWENVVSGPLVLFSL